MNDCTQESFLKDVGKHEIQVVRDDGHNRHIRFKEPGSSNMYFDLITWAGYLCFTGDMGTYVFSRLDDMFEFFRTDKGRINRQYWSEKLQAVDCSGANKGCAVEFSRPKFDQMIKETLGQWIREGKEYGSLDKDERRQLWDAVNEDVFDSGYDDGHSLLTRAHEFSWTIDPRGRDHVYSFDDLSARSYTDYTYHFTWCCYALAWGIKQYDDYKESMK